MQQAIQPISTVLNANYKKQLAANEYQLILSPHEELADRIRQIRSAFNEAFQVSAGVNGSSIGANRPSVDTSRPSLDTRPSPGANKPSVGANRLSVPSGKPNLTIVRFTQLAMMEERIVQRLRNIAMGYCPFKVELKDFGSLPTHSIFINVTSKLPIRSLVKEVREVQSLMKLDKEHKPHFIDEPNLLIARNLLPWQYEKGWLEYENKSFTGRFIADGMLLLRRRAGSSAGSGPWQIVERFAFQNLPVTTRQGELFA